MSLLRAGQGDPRCPARENERWGDYIERLSLEIKNGTLGDFPRAPGAAWSDVGEIPDTYRLPYKETEDREPGAEG